MKKKLLSVICIVSLILAGSLPFENMVQASGLQDTKHNNDNSIQEYSRSTDETSPEILEEIVCDQLSQEIVDLQIQNMDYSVSDWIDKNHFSYLIFEKNSSGDTSYYAYGYAIKEDGTAVFIALSSKHTITQESADRQILKILGNQEV